MYDSKRIKKEDPITLDYILSRVTEYDIYARYIGQFKIVISTIVHLEKIKILHLEYLEVGKQVNSYLKIMVMVFVET